MKRKITQQMDAFKRKRKCFTIEVDSDIEGVTILTMAKSVRLAGRAVIIDGIILMFPSAGHIGIYQISGFDLAIARTRRKYAKIKRLAEISGLADLEECPKLLKKSRKKYVAACRRAGIIPDAELFLESRRKST